VTAVLPLPAQRARPAADPEPAVRGESLLRALETWLMRLLRLTRPLPDACNPLLQAGAVANLTLIVAIASGVLLLFWYVPSVHQAHASVLWMDAQRFGGGFVRTLHRYSSDLCIALVLWHALQVFAQRRFTGPRWLAWATGIASLAALWFIGWLGYWLVWDQRAQQVALGTAQMLDCLPVFVDPLGRGFLTDATVHSLLFFVVFFAHMLLPVLLGIGLWLHIARLARTKFLPGRRLAAWTVAVLVVMSLVWPADTAPAARMAHAPEAFAMDWWYLAPLWMTDRFGGALLWLVLLAGFSLLVAVPRLLRRGQTRAARVEPTRCNACYQCSRDCPYAAITMVPRTDGKPLPVQAQVDPRLCVGCGICAGSCDSAGVGLDWLPVVDRRLEFDRWLEQQPGARLVFACAHGAGASLHVDPTTGACAELDDARVQIVPCAGWVHMLTAERALRKGASAVVLAACPPGECHYREGAQWTADRLAGTRKPFLGADKVDRSLVTLVEAGRDEIDLLRGKPARRRAPAWTKAAALLIVLVLAVALWFVSVAPYRVAGADSPELIVSFKHPGRASEVVRMLTPEEIEKLPFHMRRDRIVERHRASVRLRLRVDGEVVHEQSYEPSGLWHDGNSIAIARLPLAVGRHQVEVWIGESADPDEWTFRSSGEIDAQPRARLAVLFDRVSGFRWP
jgi:ferredoxin